MPNDNLSWILYKQQLGKLYNSSIVECALFWKLSNASAIQLTTLLAEGNNPKFWTVHQTVFFSWLTTVHSLLVSIETVSVLPLHGLAVTACHAQRGGFEANHSGVFAVWSVQAITGSNDDKCSEEGLTLQLQWRPTVYNTLRLQKQFSQLVA